MSTLKLFDVHTHTQFVAFKDETDAAIKRALDAGIWLVNIGTQRDTSAKAIEIANKYPEGVYATVGLHPIHTEKSYHDEQELGIMNKELGNDSGFVSRGEDFDYEYYKKLAQDSKVVAIGECGLDYYKIKNTESRIKQEKAFRDQIALASELKKPLMIHCRQAFDDLIKILDSCFLIHVSEQSGIVHFFSGTVDDAQKLLDLGFSFSFGGVITFARDYDEVLKYIPLDRVLLETDAPYVTPTPFRGKRNEPLYVEEVASKIGETVNKDFSEIARITTENAMRIFGIS